MNVSAVMDDLADALAAQSLDLDGASGTFASTPDSAALSITGDIDIRVRVAADDWTASQTFVSKALATGNQRSWRFLTNGTGNPFLALSVDGVAEITGTSSAATGFADGTTHWVRVVWRQSDGRLQFFTSDDGDSWVQLGVDRAIAVASIFDSTAAVEVGARNGGGNDLLAGNVYYAEVRDGIDGTVVADPDFASVAEWEPGATEAKDGAGNTWTLNGAAEIVRAGIARAYGFPVDNVAPPAAVVGYPEEIIFDVTKGRGVDQLEFPVFVLVGRLTDRTARDLLGVYLDGSGAESVKQVLKDGTYSAMSSVRARSAVVDVVTIAGVEHLAAVFTVDVYGPGG